MSDMRRVITPKSDQLNSDDLLAGPLTIKITGVIIKSGQEQPVAVSYEGDNGKPYKACKSMCRVMVAAWGADSSKYVGKSMTLYCDPKVKWAGMEVGGIRISHMSDIPETMTMALTVTKGSKKPYVIQPLKVQTVQPQATVQAPQPSQRKRLIDLVGKHQASLTQEEIEVIKSMIPQKGTEDENNPELLTAAENKAKEFLERAGVTV